MSRPAIHSLLKHVKLFLDKHSVQSGKVLVAVSGGPDSIALLQALQELSSTHQLPLLAAHLNHRLRGEESEEDAAFVQQFCAKRAIPCIIDRVSDGDLKPQQSHLESNARRLRYQWLEKTAKREDCRWIMTGHTMNDQAETVLHHLLRGTGWRGMRGIAPVKKFSLLPSSLGGEGLRGRGNRFHLLRPLIETTREDVMDFLNSRSITTRHDSSNDDPRFMRNRIRHQIMPLLTQLVNRQAVQHLAQLADRARQYYPRLRQRGRRLLEKARLSPVNGVFVCNQKTLAQASDEILHEALQQLWQANGWPSGRMNAARWREVTEVCRLKRPQVQLPDGIVVRYKVQVVQFFKEH